MRGSQSFHADAQKPIFGEHINDARHVKKVQIMRSCALFFGTLTSKFSFHFRNAQQYHGKIQNHVSKKQPRFKG